MVIETELTVTTLQRVLRPSPHWAVDGLLKCGGAVTGLPVGALGVNPADFHGPAPLRVRVQFSVEAIPAEQAGEKGNTNGA